MLQKISSDDPEVPRTNVYSGGVKYEDSGSKPVSNSGPEK